MVKIMTISILIAGFIISGCFEEKKSSSCKETIINLVKIDSILISDEHSLSMRKIYGMSLIDSHFLLIDGTNKKIHKYDARGNYVSSIGGMGQGPEEFMLPIKVRKNNSYIFVLDISNFKINKYNSQLEYMESIKLPDSLVVFDFQIVNDSTLLVGAQGRHHDLEKMKPIKLYDCNSNQIIREFGEFDPKYSKYKIFNFYGIFLSSPIENYMYLAFPASETVYKYDLSGKLIKMFVNKNKHFPFVDQNISEAMGLDKKMKIVNHYYRTQNLFIDRNFIYLVYRKDAPDKNPFDNSLEKSQFFVRTFDHSGELLLDFTKLPGQPLHFDAITGNLFIYEKDFPHHVIGVYRIES